MTNEDWNRSDNPIEMLEALKSYSAPDFIGRIKLLQTFYIECCRKYLSLWPDSDFIAALDFAENHSSEHNKEELKKHDYNVEGSIFALQYNPETETSQKIINHICKLTNLSKDESFDYAVSFGYFVDWVLLYRGSWNGKIPVEYAHFLDANILRKHIKQPFIS